MHGPSGSLLHDDKSAGINLHVDSIQMLENTIGPIFTITMGREDAEEKMLDKFPIMSAPDEPVRIFTQPHIGHGRSCQSAMGKRLALALF